MMWPKYGKGGEMAECEQAGRWESWCEDESGDVATHEPGRPWVAVCRQHNRRAHGGTESLARENLRQWCAIADLVRTTGV